MEWNKATTIPQLTFSCASGGSRLSTSKYVKLDDGSIKTANYFKTDDNREGWNVSKGEVVEWAEIDGSITVKYPVYKISTSKPVVTETKPVENKAPIMKEESLW